MKRRVLRAHANKRHLRHICASHALSPNNYNVIVDASFLRSVIQAYMSEYKVQVNTMSSHASTARHATNRTGQKMLEETNTNSYNYDKNNSCNDNFTQKENKVYNCSSYSKTINNHNQHGNITYPCKISSYLIKLAEEAFGSLESVHINAHAHEPYEFDEQERNSNNNSGSKFNNMHHRYNNKFSTSSIQRNNYHSMESDVKHKVKKLRIRFCVLECTKRVLLQMIAKHNNTVALQRGTRTKSQHHESKSKFNQFKLRKVVPSQLVEQLFRFLEVIKQSDDNDLYTDGKNLPSSLSKDANKHGKHVKRVSLPEEQNEVKAIASFMEFCNAEKRFGHNGAGEVNDANSGKETIQSKINKYCAEKRQVNVNESVQEHSCLLSQQCISSSSPSQFHLRTDIANPYDYFVATQSHDVRKHLSANTALLRFAFEPNCIWIEVNGNAYQYNTSSKTESITGNSKLSSGCATSYKLSSNLEKLINDVGRGVNTTSSERSANEVSLFSAADLAFMQHLGKLPKHISVRNNKIVVDSHDSAKQITQTESNTKNANINFISTNKDKNSYNALWNAESKEKEKSLALQSPLETSSLSALSAAAAATATTDDNCKIGNKRYANNEHVTKATVKSKRKRQNNPNPLSVKKKRKREVLRIDASLTEL